MIKVLLSVGHLLRHLINTYTEMRTYHNCTVAGGEYIQSSELLIRKINETKTWLQHLQIKFIKLLEHTNYAQLINNPQ